MAELSARIQTLSDANGQLRAALLEQSDLLAEYQAAGALGTSALDVSREELRRIRAYSGLSAVEGQGIIVRVSGDLDAIAVNDLINELRNAGAEALAVDGTRVRATTVVQGASALLIDGMPSTGPSPSPRSVIRMAGAALQRPGGIVTQLEQFVRATITVSPTVPAPAGHRS